MRPSILPNLLEAAGRNAARGYGDLALFEVGPHYEGDAPKDQRLTAAGLRVGRNAPRHWAAPPRPVDALRRQGRCAGAADGAAARRSRICRSRPMRRPGSIPGRSGVLRLGATVLAQFGELHPRVLARPRREGAGGRLRDRSSTASPSPGPRRAPGRPLLKVSPFQPVERDFAFVVAGGSPAEKLVRAARSADKALITNVSRLRSFEGGSLGRGQKSIALSVTLQPTERTLTEAEIEAVGAKIVAAVNKATGGTLRG